MAESKDNGCSTFDQYMKDKELKEEYDKLGPEYKMIKSKIKAYQQE